MKNIFIFLVFLGILAPLMAQKESLETKMFFSSRNDAEKAFRSGAFRYYQPDSANLKTRPPRLAKGLPCTYVALESVRENKGKSPAWVLLPSGTPAEFNSDGTPIVDGRCWNKIRQAFPVEKYVSLSMVGKLYGPPGKDGHTPVKGKDYSDGKNGRDGKNIIQESNSTSKTLFPFSGGIIGGLIGGYGFPKENEIATQTITPGTKVQTGDGTFVYGPQKTKTDVRVEKSFNWTGAVIGTGSGLILGYLLNEVIF